MVIISGLDLGDFEGILYHCLKDWIFCVTATKIHKNITLKEKNEKLCWDSLRTKTKQKTDRVHTQFMCGMEGIFSLGGSAGIWSLRRLLLIM